MSDDVIDSGGLGNIHDEVSDTVLSYNNGIKTDVVIVLKYRAKSKWKLRYGRVERCPILLKSIEPTPPPPLFFLIHMCNQ